MLRFTALTKALSSLIVGSLGMMMMRVDRVTLARDSTLGDCALNV
jgi:hypothetical protein